MEPHVTIRIDGEPYTLPCGAYPPARLLDMAHEDDAHRYVIGVYVAAPKIGDRVLSFPREGDVFMIVEPLDFETCPLPVV